MMKNLSCCLVCLLGAIETAAAQYEGWRHAGFLWILTTPEGADLPAACAETNFPLLVRLNRENFDFGQAQSRGEDIRFSDTRGTPLAYQIDEWDAARGTASIWVRIPEIGGNARQEIKMLWGKPGARSQSDGGAVFNAGNGFCTVLHLDETLRDEAGSLKPVNARSTPARGIIGACRHCVAGTGVNGGDHIANYPFSDGPFTSEAWFRPEAAGADIVGWGRYATRYNGKTGDGNEVVLAIGAPPSIGWSSDGPGGARGSEPVALNCWHHVAATYSDGTSRIYVDGKLAGSNYQRHAMSIVRDINMNVGGMRGGYNFTGDIDEVRVSRVARSAHWIKLEYENQKARQTLVGALVPPGNQFSVSRAEIKIDEGRSATIAARAGGAQKVYWILKRDGTDTVVAVDQLSYTLDAGRVTNDTPFVLEFKAVYAGEVKVRDIPVTIKEAIPEPVFTLRAPAAWNGRAAIEVVPEISNLAAMRAAGAGELHYAWTVSGGAVLKEVAPDRLILKRSQCTGPIGVRLALNNGGADVAAMATIQVTEPQQDPWVQRVPDKDEKPEDNQFYARDDRNEGTLYYNGRLDEPSAPGPVPQPSATAPGEMKEVFLKVYAGDKLFARETRKLGADKTYAFSVKLKPGLIKYRVEFGTALGGAETVLRTARNLVCGDAYIIDGQSNAEATGPNNGPNEDPVMPVDDWIRSYGNYIEGTTRGGWGNAVRTHIWGRPNYGCHQVGAWGMVLARDLVEKHHIPICIINGAIGGTPIWHHQANPENHYDTSGEFYHNPYRIYGCLLTRVAAARLTHGIRGVFWHQGENDSNSGAPTGDYNYKSYQQYFVEMSAAWKRDYPNIRHYYVFQVWPAPCNMGPKDDELREAQRTLPRLYSNLRVMSTVGIVSKATGRGTCHFDLDGYAQMARLLRPLIEQEEYGVIPKQAITAPNLCRTWFTNPARDEIALDFGQPMLWKDDVKRSFRLDGAVANIASGSAAGDVVTLKLAASCQAKTISYLSGREWDGNPKYLIRGANGIAALTFCNVDIAAPQTARLSPAHAFTLTAVASAAPAATAPKKGPVKVFILAGQSNMDGQADVRTIDFLGEDPAPARAALLTKFKPGGKLVTRGDVWGTSDDVSGDLGPGYGGRRDYSKLGHCIGPEYGSGNFMGEASKNQLLLIKYAPGGQSLHQNFRPPGAGLPRPLPLKNGPNKTKVPMTGEDFGGQYRGMVAYVRDVLKNRVLPAGVKIFERDGTTLGSR